jgi:hypothetical protein
MMEFRILYTQKRGGLLPFSVPSILCARTRMNRLPIDVKISIESKDLEMCFSIFLQRQYPKESKQLAKDLNQFER